MASTGTLPVPSPLAPPSPSPSAPPCPSLSAPPSPSPSPSPSPAPPSPSAPPSSPSAPPSPPPPPPPPQKYEVFLSFRGADTRFGFADTLYHALKDKGMVVFRDEDSLKMGEEINPALRRAIKESKCAVVVVSEHFADSKACLFELTVIMECRRMKRLKVFPIFYKVDASDVGNLTNNFGSHFEKLKGNPQVGKEQWEKWRSILEELGESSLNMLDKNLSESCGRALKKLTDLRVFPVKNRYETLAAREISATIFPLVGNSASISESLIGIESQEKEIMRLLNIAEPTCAAAVTGICGLLGIGKSTLAEVIFEKLSHLFDSWCFIHLIGTTTNDLLGYQKKLIYDIIDIDLENLDHRRVKNVLRQRLRKRVFIVLDNAQCREQVNALAEKLEWFDEGSKIIITSRHRNLPHLDQNNVYEVKELNKEDALQLFCLKAFKQLDPKPGFRELAAEFTSCAKGLPLALDTFGSYLSSRLDKDFWHCYLKELRTGLNDPVSEKFVEFLNDLAPRQRKLVLHIANSYKGRLEGDFGQMLEDRDYNLGFNLKVLEDKFLLRISNKRKLLVHDIIVDVGQKLVKRDGCS